MARSGNLGATLGHFCRRTFSMCPRSPTQPLEPYGNRLVRAVVDVQSAESRCSLLLSLCSVQYRCMQPICSIKLLKPVSCSSCKTACGIYEAHSCVIAASQCCLCPLLSKRPSSIALLLCRKYISAASALCKKQYHVATFEGCVHCSCARSPWVPTLPFKLPQLPFVIVPSAFQVIYPLSTADAVAKEGLGEELTDASRKALEQRLDELMEAVRLSYLVTREGGWDANTEWGETLSLGTTP